MVETALHITNTLRRKKEAFRPLNPPHVGLYVCGPTVYGDAHLGHARPAVVFDMVYRYLRFLGYRVRYVRNITDVGHLESDHDEGEDKIGKKARIEQLEPMEVVQRYTNRYHEDMDKLRVEKPSIEPRASGHIPEQIELVRQILAAGLAYEVNGSVYFDLPKYQASHPYGQLSGRNTEELMAGSRDLDGGSDKKHPTDFALWKKAGPEHIQRWPSPWGEGFPGWHLECSAMSAKYLGEVFDIHGGGMDLLFPHHECEMAQSVAATGKESVRYWMHNNMLTVNGKKMGKSLGNFITLREFFSGDHPALEQAYSPGVIRFFILQAHYRSTLDFSNEALQASEKGLKRLEQAAEILRELKPSKTSGTSMPDFREECLAAMNDDFNSPVAIARLFDAARLIHSARDGHVGLSGADIRQLESLFGDFGRELFDLLEPTDSPVGGRPKEEVIKGLMGIILDIRQKAREEKDWDTSDRIRQALEKLRIQIKDGKDGSGWNWSE